MVGILVVTHGNFGVELVKSAELIVGEQKNCKAIGLFPGNTIEEFKLNILNEAKSLDEGDGVLIFADLYGGTPFNSVVLNMNEFEQANVSIECIIGVNLPMILEAFSSRSFLQLEELKAQCLNVGLESIKDLKQQLSNYKY
ncbi:PTS sugar transporter subunit IIA [Thermoanaerobacter siderophilus]|uniref:Phosphotransferase system, mannose/fructose-specific component IIA n=1 Tax=Thermoanaerobacter siderophilus SR4 TaxID=880478 RepID=I9ABR0_9THEO|nr:PTS sugar transporter subunit IIA [Thermoanaerobacter siderophilus]EIV99436.1 phosphotransferase system, mannose/fructose-specific component IIA [Thermoanaerobacter siderophilus SR4]